MKNYTNNGENLTIDPSLKNKCIAFCPELSFGILSFSTYEDIEAMNFLFDQVYSNIRVPTQVNTSQHESTRVRRESTRVRHESTRINTTPKLVLDKILLKI